MPSFVMLGLLLIGLPELSTKVKPLLSILVPPAVTASTLTFFANLTFNVPLSATTPILLSDNSDSLVIPPFTSTCVPSLRANAVPLSPPNVNGLKA